jgi:uncharacterized protein
LRSSGTTIELSASDLSQFLGCRHRTALDLAVAHGQREAPTWVDPVMLVLQQRGLDHERGYADALRAEGLVVVDLAEQGGDDAVARTLDAMRAGANVILQPALRNGRWFGRPDVLRRVETSSGLGAWSYQVVDTKLAKETRGAEPFSSSRSTRSCLASFRTPSPRCSTSSRRIRMRPSSPSGCRTSRRISGSSALASR